MLSSDLLSVNRPINDPTKSRDLNTGIVPDSAAHCNDVDYLEISILRCYHSFKRLMYKVTIPVVCASVKNSLGCSLDEDLGAVTDAGGLLGCAV